MAIPYIVHHEEQNGSKTCVHVQHDSTNGAVFLAVTNHLGHQLAEVSGVARLTVEEADEVIAGLQAARGAVRRERGDYDGPIA